MIASMIVKQNIRSAFDKLLNRGDIGYGLAAWADDAVWDSTSHLGVGGTIKGKKAAEEWLRKWLEEFPKRNIVVKNICFAAWPLSPTNVVMVDWTAEETSRDGKEFKYDGVSVTHVKNRKVIHTTEYISFKGLPQISNLIKSSVIGRP